MPLEPSILAVLESAINSIDGLSVPDVHSQHVEDFWLDLQRIREAPREDYVDLLIRTALRRWERNNEVLETVIASGPGTVLEQLLSLFEGRCSTADRGSSRLLEERAGRGNSSTVDQTHRYIGLSAPSPPSLSLLRENGSTLTRSILPDNFDHLSNSSGQVDFEAFQSASGTRPSSTTVNSDSVQVQTNETGEDLILTWPIVVGVVRELLLRR